MSTLWLALIVSSGGVLFSALFQWNYRRERRARLQGLELKPNCLLTRYPVVFLAGRRSPFRLFDHWNEVPNYLREHGYEVLVVDPMVPGRPARTLELLQALPRRFHVIADSSAHVLLEEIAALRFKGVVTLTMIQNAATAKRVTRPQPSLEDLKPLGTPIETFSLSIAKSEYLHDWKTLFVRLFTYAHNRFFANGHAGVDAFETASVGTVRPWSIEMKFLDLVVGLAERDACAPRERP